jgi:hypothetical protein
MKLLIKQTAAMLLIGFMGYQAHADQINCVILKATEHNMENGFQTNDILRNITINRTSGAKIDTLFSEGNVSYLVATDPRGYLAIFVSKNNKTIQQVVTESFGNKDLLSLTDFEKSRSIACSNSTPLPKK